MRRDRTGYAKLVSDMCAPFAAYTISTTFSVRTQRGFSVFFFFFHQILSRCGYGYRMEWKLERNIENTDGFIGGAYIVVVRKSIKANIWTKCFILRWTRCSRAPHAVHDICGDYFITRQLDCVYITRRFTHITVVPSQTGLNWKFEIGSIAKPTCSYSIFKVPPNDGRQFVAVIVVASMNWLKSWARAAPFEFIKMKKKREKDVKRYLLRLDYTRTTSTINDNRKE